MSILSVYHVSSPELPNKVLTHQEDIASTLAEQGIAFSRLPSTLALKAGASEEEVLDACRVQIDQLMTEHGLDAVEVISIDGPVPSGEPRREHYHHTDELRFFVAGRGLLSLRVGDFVYAVLCEKNDLIAIPAGTRQWFDLGDHPRLIATRLFRDGAGRQGVPTGDAIADEFPGLDD
ncbi:acireductone dioxygenase [Pseudomonas sp. Pseu.R1]|uniref:acireductone dioxygenase n=1 Tax=Pseudomonas sp. Pseu.R1 TaxID=3379818 RepID=UPI003B92AB7D